MEGHSPTKRHIEGKNPKSSGSKARASPLTTGNCIVVMRMVWFSEKEQPLGKRSWMFPEPLGVVGAVFHHLEGKRPRAFLLCEALAVGSGCRWAEGGETGVQRSERGLNIPLRKRTAVAPLRYSFKIPSVKKDYKNHK